MAAERRMKLAVLDWLTDGKPKLFRSPSEGNYQVRLMNVSLTPDDKLSRMIHTFSATCYEVGDPTVAALRENGVVVDREIKVATVAKTTQVDTNSSGTFSAPMRSAQIQNVDPGTTITYDGNDYMVGATGTLNIDAPGANLAYPAVPGGSVTYSSDEAVDSGDVTTVEEVKTTHRVEQIQSVVVSGNSVTITGITGTSETLDANNVQFIQLNAEASGAVGSYMINGSMYQTSASSVDLSGMALESIEAGTNTILTLYYTVKVAQV